MQTPLKPYAVSETNSRGRVHGHRPSTDRNEFQRDYTRITHSRALRRLQGKTQVFSANSGELARTRLTHSMEVAQLAKSAAKRLGLNHDLCDVLAIAHDIGHPPFGHMGQDTLDELMAGHGGFEHNHQALRIVDQLESPYWEHPGLNLMFETREGLLKHCTQERAQLLGNVADRHIKGQSPPLETQLVDWVDAIAYLHADLEDAYNMSLMSGMENHVGTPFWVDLFAQVSPDGSSGFSGVHEAWDEIKDRFDGHDPVELAAAGDPRSKMMARSIVREVISHMLHQAMEDLVATSEQRIFHANPRSLDDVRALPELIGFSPAMKDQHLKLKAQSRQQIYNHAHIVETRVNEKRKLVHLFHAYLEDPSRMGGIGILPGQDIHRAVCDHLAGMTDAHVHRCHDKLLSPAMSLPRARKAGPG